MALLKDPVLDRWVLIAPERAARPGARATPRSVRGDDATTCPFCPGHERETPPELWADRPGGEPDTPGWRVRVFANKYPALQGAHEVIVEHPEHSADLATMQPSEIERALVTYARRLEALAAGPEVRYVALFRNAGLLAGATQAHPHAQLLALPLVPSLVRAELRGAEAVHAQRGCCPYCELAEAAPASGRLVSTTLHHVAFCPPAPRVPAETWILPVAHAPLFGARELGDLATCLGEVARRVAQALGEPAYTLYLHQAPASAAVSPSYHWHLELLPRTSGVAGFELATEMFINPVGPEEAASMLRAVH